MGDIITTLKEQLPGTRSPAPSPDECQAVAHALPPSARSVLCVAAIPSSALTGPASTTEPDQQSGTVAGIAVLSSLHARDAARFADRHNVAVHLPTWMDGVADNVETSIEHYTAPTDGWTELGNSGISVRTVDPTTAWKEAIAYREADRTLRIPDMINTAPTMTLQNERLGWYPVHRLAPPREAFADINPERILFGHGEGITDDPGTTLQTALDEARRNFPRAIVTQAPSQIRDLISALRA